MILLEQHRQAGFYCGHISHREKPVDLPVIRSTKFEPPVREGNRSISRCATGIFKPHDEFNGQSPVTSRINIRIPPFGGIYVSGRKMEQTRISFARGLQFSEETQQLSLPVDPDFFEDPLQI